MKDYLEGGVNLNKIKLQNINTLKENSFNNPNFPNKQKARGDASGFGKINRNRSWFEKNKKEDEG